MAGTKRSAARTCGLCGRVRIALSGRPLKEEFCAELDKPRRVSAQKLAENRAVDIAVHGLGSEELRMVESVEAFDAELHRFRFRKAQVLEESQIIVVQA